MKSWPVAQPTPTGVLPTRKFPILHLARIRTGGPRSLSGHSTPAGFRTNARLFSCSGNAQQCSSRERHAIPPIPHPQRRASRSTPATSAKMRDRRDLRTLVIESFGQIPDIFPPNRTAGQGLCLHTRGNKGEPRSKTLAPRRFGRQPGPRSRDLPIELVAPLAAWRIVRTETWTKQSPRRLLRTNQNTLKCYSHQKNVTAVLPLRA